MAAALAAIPLRSLPDEAAVAEVFGTFPVLAAVHFILSRPTWNSSAMTWATLVYNPCPISVPPWFNMMLPSRYTCSRAPAWL